jgi:hypothetical protein
MVQDLANNPFELLRFIVRIRLWLRLWEVSWIWVCRVGMLLADPMAATLKGLQVGHKLKAPST